MIRERRFIRFLNREGALPAFITFMAKNMDCFFKLRKAPPKLFLGWHFQRNFTSIEEAHYWNAINEKWQKVLLKDYSQDKIIMQKQKIVKDTFYSMLGRGGTDEICVVFYEDVEALENAILKLDFQIKRRFK